MPGHKAFASTTLAAADVNDYLMKQAVMTFTSASARDTALSGVLRDGLYAYLTDTPKRLTRYDGTQWKIVLSDWQDWSTPTWSSGVTAGDGTWDAVWRYEDGAAHIRAQFTLGSTSAVSANPQFSLSGYDTFGGVGTATHISLGHSFLRDTNLGVWEVGAAVVGIGGNTVLIKGTGADISSTSPFTWASGDLILLDIVVVGPTDDAA